MRVGGKHPANERFACARPAQRPGGVAGTDLHRGPCSDKVRPDVHLIYGRGFVKRPKSIADFSVAAITIYFKRLGIPSDHYPALTEWYQQIHALDAWRSTNVEPWVP